MQTTRESLLVGVKDRTDSGAWTQFHQLYSKLIEGYARERGLCDADASDVAGECMHLLYEKLPDFQYDPRKGRFRAWLRRVVNNKIADMFRKRPSVYEDVNLLLLEDGTPGPQQVWEKKWQKTHMAYCLAQVKQQVSPEYFEAFRLYVLEKQAPEQVSKTLDISVDQVYLIKSRVLTRLRSLVRSMERTEGSL